MAFVYHTDRRRRPSFMAELDMAYRHRLLGLVGSIALGLAACGSNSGAAADGGGGAAGGGAGSGGGLAGSTGSAGTGGGGPGFITGTVDGVVVRAETDLKAGVQGTLAGQIWIV